MHIVCISASLIPSSTANSIQVMKACQVLAQIGHQVRLLATGSKNLDWEALAGHYGLHTPFDIEWLPSNKRLKRYDFSLAAVRRAKALKADAVYVWPPQAALLALILKIPVLLELHGEPEGAFGPLVFRQFVQRPGEKRLLPITRALVVELEQTHHYKLNPGEVVVAPNGVDLERYQGLPDPAEARHLLGLPERLTAGYTGHLYPGRGMGMLLELALHFPKVQFLWAGGRTGDIQRWQERLAEAGAANVHLTGFVENSRLPLYQAAADILLMPYERQIAGSSGGDSARYCSPMKMFEYMACGRPVISSDLPVIREVLNESNAVLLPPEDTQGWIDALSTLLDDRQERHRLSRQALQDVQGYTWQERARRALEGFVKEGKQ